MSKKITGTRYVTDLDDADLITGVDVDDANASTKNIQITKANALKDHAKTAAVTAVQGNLDSHEAAVGNAAHTGMATSDDLAAHRAASSQHTIPGVTGLQAALNAKADSAALGDAAGMDITQDSSGVARGDRPDAVIAAHVAAAPGDAHANLPTNSEKAALAGPGVNNPPGAANAYLTEEDLLTLHSQLGGKDTDGHPGSIIETSLTPVSDANRVLVVSANGHIAMSDKVSDQIGSGGSSGLHADLTDLDESGHNGNVILVGGEAGKAVTVALDGTLQNSGVEPGGAGGIGEADADGRYYARYGSGATWVPSPVSPIGGLSLHYGYTDSTSPTPVIGTIHTNSPNDLQLATLIYVNKTSNNANDVSVAWDSYQEGDYIGIWEEESDHGEVVYKLTAPPALTGNVYTLNVEYLPGSSTNTIDNGNQVIVYQIPNPLGRIPPLGLNGQVLAKASDTSQDTEWVLIPDPGISDAPGPENYVRSTGAWSNADDIYAPIAHSNGALNGATGHVSAQDRTDWGGAKDHADVTDANPHGVTRQMLGAASDTVNIIATTDELDGGGAITSNVTLGLADHGGGGGSFTNASITVDVKGRVTAASSGTGGDSGPKVRQDLGYPTTTAQWDMVAGPDGFTLTCLGDAIIENPQSVPTLAPGGYQDFLITIDAWAYEPIWGDKFINAPTPITGLGPLMIAGVYDGTNFVLGEPVVAV